MIGHREDVWRNLIQGRNVRGHDDGSTTEVSLARTRAKPYRGEGVGTRSDAYSSRLQPTHKPLSPGEARKGRRQLIGSMRGRRGASKPSDQKRGKTTSSRFERGLDGAVCSLSAHCSEGLKVSCSRKTGRKLRMFGGTTAGGCHRGRRARKHSNPSHFGGKVAAPWTLKGARRDGRCRVEPYRASSCPILSCRDRTGYHTRRH